MSQGRWNSIWDETWAAADPSGKRPPPGWSPAWHYATEHHLTPRGKRMDFVGRRHLLEPYRILTPEFLTRREIALMKSPQVGASELVICLVLGLAGELGWQVLYILDTYMTRNRFVQTRIDKAIRRVPYYHGLLRANRDGADNMAVKEFGRGVIVFAGSNTEGQFIEFSADLVVNDELDRCDLENVAMALDRLQAPESKGARVHLSSPTHEGFGIAERYYGSTEHVYRIPCPGCGDEVEPTWVGCVVEESGKDFALLDRDWTQDSGRDVRMYCPGCGAALDRSVPGRWVPKNPGARRVGYHLSKLIDPTTRLSEAWTDWLDSRENARKRELWWNRWPGLPHSESGSRLTEKELARAVGTTPEGEPWFMPDSSPGPCVAGVDVGVVLHVAISLETRGRSPFVFLGKIPVELREVVRLFHRYGVRSVVFDADPEKSQIRKWCAALRRMGIKAWRCRYREDGLGRMEVKPEEHLVKVDRTMSLDESTEDFTADPPRVVLPADFRSIDSGRFVAEMGRPVRVIEERQGRSVAVWRKNPPEDFRHAVNYRRMAADLHRRFGGGGRPLFAGERVFGGQVQPEAKAETNFAEREGEDLPRRPRRRRGGIRFS